MNKTVKQISMVLVGFAVVVFLVGNLSSDSKSSSAPDTAVTTAPPVDTYVPPTPKEQFLSDINSLNDPIIAQTSDSELWSLATNTCSALDQGNSVTNLINYLANSGAMTNDNAKSIGEIIGASVKDVCPSHLSELQDYINQYGS